GRLNQPRFAGFPGLAGLARCHGRENCSGRQGRECGGQGKGWLGGRAVRILPHHPTEGGTTRANMHITGIIPPVATPMQANEDLDLPRLTWFLDHLIQNGVHAVFVLGTNSEFYALDEREKQEVMATAVAHVNRRVPVYAGTGAETTREAVRLTRLAEKEGVDGVSVITPYFVNPTQ